MSILPEHVKAVCIVPRMVWGQFVPAPPPPRGLASLGPNGQGVAMQPFDRSTVHHELRIRVGGISDEMYCIFCGEIGTPEEWAERIRATFVPAAKGG